MSKRIKYTKGPIGDVKIVEDFLPPPSELVLKEEVEKVTISLSKRSVDFFKGEAKRNGTQYQRMIRALLDRYRSAELTTSALRLGVSGRSLMRGRWATLRRARSNEMFLVGPSGGAR